MQRREQEYLVQQSLLGQLQRGRINRRQFMTRMMAAGLGIAGVSAAMSGCVPAAPGGATAGAGAGASSGRPLTPTFYQWIEDLHPSIPQVNSQFEGINYQIAPVEGFGIERFVAEAKNSESTWDVYVGMTPFVEMT
jgi:multiple sugar transport system substrate-binding protein